MSEQPATYKPAGHWLVVHNREIVDVKETEEEARACAERQVVNVEDVVNLYRYAGTCKPKRVAEWING